MAKSARRSHGLERRRAPGRLQWPAMMVPVTHSEMAGFTTELRRGRPLGLLHGMGEGQRGGHGSTAREEEVAEPSARVREGGRERGHGLVGRLSQLGCSGPKVEGWLLGHLGQKLKEKSFWNKNWILNILGLWKFIQGHLVGILIWGFFLNSSRLLKDFRKILYVMPCNAILMQLT
jgi:hypothetical protein